MGGKFSEAVEAEGTVGDSRLIVRVRLHENGTVVLREVWEPSQPALLVGTAREQYASVRNDAVRRAVLAWGPDAEVVDQ